MADVSVLIVTWNNEEEIEACIESVINNSKQNSNLGIELILIDNNSQDKTFEKLKTINFHNLQVYRNEKNAGYTKAVNQLLKYSKGKNVLLLNPDTILKTNCLATLNNFLNENDDYAACCPLLLNEDNSIQNSIRNFPSYWTMFCEFSLLAYIFPYTKLFGRWKMKYFNYMGDADVNQPMAAALMVKKSVLDRVNNMDERFEMFFNDVDLCRKIIDSKYRIRFVKNAEVIHKKGASIYKDRVRMIKIWNKDCVKYFEKYHNNAFLMLWLKFSLKVSEIIRILYYKLVINNK